MTAATNSGAENVYSRLRFSVVSSLLFLREEVYHYVYFWKALPEVFPAKV